MSTITTFDALHSMVGGELHQLSEFEFVYLSGQPQKTKTEIQAEMVRLEALEPLRLLREQRGNIHLPAWDKDVQIKFTNNNLPIPQNYLDWKQAYLDLPQNIAAGTIPAPTLDADGQLVFNGWPVLVP